MLPLDLTLENDSQPASQKLSKEPVRIKTAGGSRNRVLRRDETDGDYGHGAFKNPIDWRAATCEANSFKLQRWLQTVIRYGYIATIDSEHIVCGVFIFMFLKRCLPRKKGGQLLLCEYDAQSALALYTNMNQYAGVYRACQ